MTTIPFPIPENAHQARQNMFHWAAVAEQQVVAGAVVAPGMAAIEKARMWASIALTLPEADVDVIHADDQPIGRVPQFNTERLGVPDVGSGTDVVDSRALAALKAVTIRHIEGCSRNSTTKLTVDPGSPRYEGVILSFRDVTRGRVEITMEDQD
jgi:hypothetical protein